MYSCFSFCCEQIPGRKQKCMCACVYVFLCFSCVMEYSFTFCELTIPPKFVYMCVCVCLHMCECVFMCACERERESKETMSLMYGISQVSSTIFFFKTGLPWTDRLRYLVSEPLSISPELEL